MKNLSTALCVFLFGILTVLPIGFIYGQSFTVKYLISDGLPSQEIYDVHQDKNGMIWIACDRGIASFDGTSFKSYGLIDGIPSNMVFEFFEQSDGTIWCTTKELQLFYFHPDTLVFRNYKYNDKLLYAYENSIQEAEPRALVVGNDGSVKFRTLWRSGTISVSKDGELSFEVPDLTKAIYYVERKLVRDKSGYPSVKHLPGDEVTIPEGFRFSSRQHLIELEDTYVWTSQMAYQILRKDNFEQVQYKYFGDRPVILNVGLNDGNGSKGFWIGFMHNGVKVYDQKGRLKSHLAKDYSATTYFEDSEGGVWIGTHGSGLLYYSKSKLRLLRSSLGAEIYSLSIDDVGRLTYMTNQHLVFYVDEKLNSVFLKQTEWNDILGQYYFSNETFYNDFIRSENENGSSLRFSDNRSRFPLFVSSSFIFDQDMNILLTSRGTRRLMADAEYLGSYMVVASEKSLLKIDQKGNELKRKNLGVKIVELDVHNDLIYCATKGKGVIILDKNLRVVDRIDTSKGAPSNFVFEVLIDGDTLWIASTNGLCKAFKRTNGEWKLENITLKEGLPDREVRDIEIIDGTVFLATRGGVCYFEQSDWKEITKEETRVYFKKVDLLVNGSSRKNFLDLSHDENQLEIQYNLITFANTRKLNFRYKLIGFNDNWEITSDRRVVYKSLPPGKYELVIQALINGTPRGNPIREKIVIHPAFYNQWWFHLSLWSFVVLVIWLFFKYRILNYNRGVIQEILRQILRRLRPEKNQFIVRCDGRDVRIVSEEVIYVESSRNYITIYTTSNRYVVRHKISDFTSLVPDPLEYIRVKRSVIVRVDKVTEKGVKSIKLGDKEFKVGKTYVENLKKIEL
ncbi:MAG: LytTR family transcriptional regulator DNA-binding domain-containing protein [Flavobacteriales bacterium]|nr:LytTR family transcriptional regulator DNA-binding domain-containing protein [Flavobacteriales bacterium]